MESAAVSRRSAIMGWAAGALAAAAAVAADATAAARAAAVGVDERVPAKPFWLWELVGGASALEGRERAASALDATMTDAIGALADAGTAMGDAATALYASVPAAAAALEAANVSATSLVVLDFRDAAAAAAEQSQIGSGAADAFAQYALQAVALERSSASELASKEGPLSATRLEIEAYARSISGGVVLDVDWAPTAAGVGGPFGMGGTATWQAARGGYSTITLSNSVAENWPSADARALVTHEVGHAITSKCYRLFDYEQQAANEEWATAWTIGMGHTADGNGIQAYGYPSQDMIDLAATCR